MLVYELSLKLKCRKELVYSEAAARIAQLLNKALCMDEKFLAFHEDCKDFKFYCFDLPYPCEPDGKYKVGKGYNLRLRTVKEELAEYFLGTLCGLDTESLRCVHVDIRILPKKSIERIYSLTPLVLKNYPDGYWRDCMTTREFENRFFANLVKKYKLLTGNELDENFELYEQLRIKNQKPIRVSYKGVGLLGDKLELAAAKNETAQELLYMALGAGIGENNAIGCGFLNFRWV